MLAGLLLHLLAFAGVTAPEWFPAAWLPRPHQAQPEPPPQAQIEMVMQDTPSVGDAAQAPASAAKPPTPPPAPATPPKQPQQQQAAPAAPPPAPPLSLPPADLAGAVEPPPQAAEPKEPPPQEPPPKDQASKETQKDPAPQAAPKADTAPQTAPQPAPASKAASAAAEAAPGDIDSAEVRLGDPDSGTGIVTGQVIPAKPDSKFRNRPPAFPLEAAQRGEFGAVDTVIHIQPDGTVGEVEIVSSSGYALLDVATLQALKKWRFHPAMQDGHPVPAEFSFTVNFVPHRSR